MSALKPELLILSVNTKSKLWWLSGTNARMPMITATPATCTHTDTALTIDSRWVLKMFTTAPTNRITAKITKVSPRMWASSAKLMKPRSRLK